MFERWRGRRAQRRARIRRVLFGDAPPLPVWSRVALPVGVALLGYTCYRFRLTSAMGFEVLGFSLITLVFLGRRLWWRRVQARRKQEGA